MHFHAQGTACTVANKSNMLSVAPPREMDKDRGDGVFARIGVAC